MKDLCQLCSDKDTCSPAVASPAVRTAHCASEANLVRVLLPKTGRLRDQPAGLSCGYSHSSAQVVASGGRMSNIALCRLKSGCRQGLSPSGGSRGESVPLPFQLPEAACILMLWPHVIPNSLSDHLLQLRPSCVPLTGTPVAPGSGPPG